MRRYQAILQTGDPIEIGEFPSDNAARLWAIQRYGADLADVIPISSYSVTATTLDPVWLAVGMLGVLLVLAWGNGKKRKRGQSVR